MSKELPYFKFIVNDWITGDVTLEDFETQGLFINICAYYWSKDGSISLSNARKKFFNARPEMFEALIAANAIKINIDGMVKINFLDEQLVERQHLSKINSRNGAQGGRPKKPVALISESEVEAKKSNIEEKREDKRREDKKREVKKPFMPPSLEEVKIFFKEKGYSEQAASTAFNYYSTADWVDGKGNKVLNWKQKMISVWFKPENVDSRNVPRQFVI
jgi:hypothetical protein